MDPNANAFILEIIQLAAGVGSIVLTGDAQRGAQISAGLLAIIQKTMAAHNSIVGQPINPDDLKPFTPLP